MDGMGSMNDKIERRPIQLTYIAGTAYCFDVDGENIFMIESKSKYSNVNIFLLHS